MSDIVWEDLFGATCPDCFVREDVESEPALPAAPLAAPAKWAAWDDDTYLAVGESLSRWPLIQG